MFELLFSLAALFFLSHVVLLVASFPPGRFAATRYFWSHATLWLTGMLLFLLTLIYGGDDRSGFVDYFDTPLKKGMILLVTALLSLTAHAIVKRFILSADSRK